MNSIILLCELISIDLKRIITQGIIYSQPIAIFD